MTNCAKDIVRYPSTFRDMHSERDLLVQDVFPRLRERCRPYNVDVIDVDLRWGIPSGSEEGKILDVCMDEIRNSKTFFLAFLGGRYGWVPSKRSRSITAEEIFEGVLEPKDEGGQILPQEERGRIRERSFFYFRNEDCHSGVPLATRNLLVDSDTERAELDKLKDRIRDYYRDLPGHLLDGYTGSFTGWRLDPSSLPNRPGVNEILAAARQDRLIDPAEFESLGDEARVMVQEFGTPYFSELETLGERILDDLWRTIHLDIGEEHGSGAPVPENHLHAMHGESLRRGFVGRIREQERLSSLIGKSGRVVVTAVPGMGTSSLLATLAGKFLESADKTLVLERYAGAGPGVDTAEKLRDSLYRELSEAAGPGPSAAGIDDPALKDRSLAELLSAVAKETRVLVILDGVQLYGADAAFLRRFGWLRHLDPWPENLSLVIGYTKREDLHDLEEFPGFEVFELKGLDQGTRSAIVEEYLSRYSKKLLTADLDRLIGKPDANRPLFLKVAANELRIHPLHENLRAKIESLPERLEALWEEVLGRIEVLVGKDMTQKVLGSLALCREGLTEHELLVLLGGERQVPPAVWARLFVQIRPFLTEPGKEGRGALSFSSASIRQAVWLRYLTDRVEDLFDTAEETDSEAQMISITEGEAVQDLHSDLADMFAKEARRSDAWNNPSPRGLKHAPFHLIQAGRSQEAAAICSDFPYLFEVVRAGLTEDYLDSSAPANYKDLVPPGEESQRKKFRSFVRKAQHLLDHGTAEWPAERILFQLASECADFEVREAAQEFKKDPRVSWELVSSPNPWLDDISLPPKTLLNHSVKISAVKPFDRYLASASWDGRVVVRNTKTFEVEEIFDCRDSVVVRLESIPPSLRLSFLENTTEVLVGLNLKGDLLSFDMRTGTTSVICSDVEGFEVGPSCFYVWGREGKNRYPVDYYQKSGTSFRRIGSFRAHEDPVLGFIQDCVPMVSWDRGGRAIGWRVPDAWLEGRDEEPVPQFLLDHDGLKVEQVLDVDVGGDHFFFLTSAADSALRIWDPSDSSVVLGPIDTGFAYVDGLIKIDESRFACWRGRIFILDLANRETRRLKKMDAVITSVSLEEDLEAEEDKDVPVALAVADETGLIRVWSPRDWEILWEVSGHEGRVNGLLWKDGRLISWGADAMVRIWDGSTGACLASVGNHRFNADARHEASGAAFLKDERYLATWGTDGTVKLWDWKGILAGTGPGFGAALTCAARIGTAFLSGHADGSIRIESEGASKIIPHPGKTRRKINGLYPLSDGKRFAAWDQGGMIRLYDLQGSEISAWGPILEPMPLRDNPLESKEVPQPVAEAVEVPGKKPSIAVRLVSGSAALLRTGEDPILLPWIREGSGSAMEIGGMKVLLGTNVSLGHLMTGRDGMNFEAGSALGGLKVQGGSLILWTRSQVLQYRIRDGRMTGFLKILDTGKIRECVPVDEDHVLVSESCDESPLAMYAFNPDSLPDAEEILNGKTLECAEPKTVLDLKDEGSRVWLSPAFVAVLSQDRLYVFDTQLSKKPLWSKNLKAENWPVKDIEIQDGIVILSDRDRLVAIGPDGSVLADSSRDFVSLARAPDYLRKATDPDALWYEESRVSIRSGSGVTRVECTRLDESRESTTVWYGPAATRLLGLDDAGIRVGLPDGRLLRLKPYS